MQDYRTKIWCSEGIHQGAFRYRNDTLAWRGVHEWLAVELTLTLIEIAVGHGLVMFQGIQPQVHNNTNKNITMLRLTSGFI